MVEVLLPTHRKALIMNLQIWTYQLVQTWCSYDPVSEILTKKWQVLWSSAFCRLQLPC